MRRLFCLTLLCILAPCALAQTKPATTQPTTRPSGGSGVQAVPPGQLLDSLLKPASSAGQPLQPIDEGPVPDVTTGKNAVAPAAPQLNLMREGTYIVDRTGRLTKSADGQQLEFTFDADAQAMQDPPVVILPNLKLMQMENAVNSSSRDLRFRISGMVTEYRGRNYVLLEKAVVIPDAVQHN